MVTRRKEETDMFRVIFGNDTAEFTTLAEARSYAEKESWMRDQTAEIRTPDGRRMDIQIRNTP